jgi:predicted metal-dependent HD superfamily phosphohydrolase
MFYATPTIHIEDRSVTLMCSEVECYKRCKMRHYVDSLLHINAVLQTFSTAKAIVQLFVDYGVVTKHIVLHRKVE